MPVQLTCDHCGKQYSVRPSRSDSKYCGKECQDEAQRGQNNPNWKPKESLTCEWCGNKYEVWPSKVEDSRFCSRGCHTNWLHDTYSGEDSPHSNRKTKTCEHCGEEFDYPASRDDTGEYERTYCGPECHRQHLVENPDRHPNHSKVQKTCKVCGKEFEVKPTRADAQFCSTRCWGAHISNNWVGHNHPNWEGGRVPYYGENWLRMRRVVRNRDCFRCQRCGTHEDECDTELHVHHIVPLREFDEPEEANTPSNLVTVCASCHGKVEGDVEAGKALL